MGADDPQRWVLLAGVWAMYVAFGLVVASLAPVLTPLSEDLGLSKSRLGAILGSWPAVFVFASIPGGWVLDRVGLRWALFCAGLLLCLSGVLRGLATGGVSLFLAVALFGVGAPMISNGAPKLVVSRFPERERARATSLYLTAPVAGQIIALATANSVIRPVAGGSWRSVPLVLAAVTGAVCVLWLILTTRLEANRRTPTAAPAAMATAPTPALAQPAPTAPTPVPSVESAAALSVESAATRSVKSAASPESAQPAPTAPTPAPSVESPPALATVPSAASTTDRAGPAYSPRQGVTTLLRNRVMQLVLMMAVLMFFVNHGINNWLPKIIEDGGMSAEAAGYLTAVSYAAGLVGPMVVTPLGARRPLVAPVLGALCLAGAIAALTVVTGLAATPFLALIGFLRFGLIGLCLLALMAVPGVDGRNMGIASGLFFTAGEIGGFSGPFAVGAIGDAGGGFDASLLTLAAAAVAAAALFAIIHHRTTHPHPPKADPSSPAPPAQ